MKNLLQYLKVTNGLFFASLLFVIIWDFVSLPTIDSKTAVMIALFFVGSELLNLVCCITFYFLTKNILEINQQIKYMLLISAVVVNLLFLISGGHDAYLPLVICFNLSVLVYIIKYLKA